MSGYILEQKGVFLLTCKKIMKSSSPHDSMVRYRRVSNRLPCAYVQPLSFHINLTITVPMYISKDYTLYDCYKKYSQNSASQSTRLFLETIQVQFEQKRSLQSSGYDTVTYVWNLCRYPWRIISPSKGWFPEISSTRSQKSLLNTAPN